MYSCSESRGWDLLNMLLNATATNFATRPSVHHSSSSAILVHQRTIRPPACHLPASGRVVCILEVSGSNLDHITIRFRLFLASLSAWGLFSVFIVVYIINRCHPFDAIERKLLKIVFFTYTQNRLPAMAHRTTYRSYLCNFVHLFVHLYLTTSV